MDKRDIIGFVAVLTIILIYSCGGSEKGPVTESSPAPVVSETVKEDLQGEAVFKKTCIACHQANGEGIANTFPPLAKSDFLADKSQVINQVINGKTGEIIVNGVKYNSIMPPQNLNDEEVADVLNYVYSSWGNSGDHVTLYKVKSIRSKKI